MDEQNIEETSESKACGNVQCVENGAEFCLVKVVHSSETQVCRMPADKQLQKDDFIIVDTKYGKDLAEVLGPVRCVCDSDMDDLTEIIRDAGEKDLTRYEENLAREKEALRICKEKVEKHGLDMKLISAHYLLDEAKILFFFTAESRVDFRELVKDLVSVFKMRIELRQIGVRDESRVLGGLAVCGRNYCCNGVTDKLKPVSIKMAKEQSLSLNSMKISGPCGRLLCCLSYEYDFYLEEKRNFPSEGSRMMSGKEQFKVLDVNVLTKKITVISNDGRFFTVPSEYFGKDEQGKWIIKEMFFSL